MKKIQSLLVGSALITLLAAPIAFAYADENPQGDVHATSSATSSLQVKSEDGGGQQQEAAKPQKKSDVEKKNIESLKEVVVSLSNLIRKIESISSASNSSSTQALLETAKSQVTAVNTTIMSLVQSLSLNATTSTSSIEKDNSDKHDASSTVDHGNKFSNMLSWFTRFFHRGN